MASYGCDESSRAMRIATKHDIEIIGWILLAPAAICLLIAKSANRRCLDAASVLFVTGSSLFWAALVWVNQLSPTSIIIANLILFIGFVHLFGIYEPPTVDNTRNTTADISLYALHFVSTVASTVLLVKIMGPIACKIEQALDVTLEICDGYDRSVMWGAVAIEVVTVWLAQAIGFFRSPLVTKDDPLSRALPLNRLSRTEASFYFAMMLTAALIL